jgi:apolipoprotein N-acyltransferase
MPTLRTTDPSAYMRVMFLSAPMRIVAALLRVSSGGSLLGVFVVLLHPEAEPLNPLRLIWIVITWCLLPALGLCLLRLRLTGTFGIQGKTLVFAQRRRRVEIPIEAIEAIEPWRLPLPDAGVVLRLRSGRRWREGIAMDDPARAIDALVDAGASPSIRAALSKPSVTLAHARSVNRMRWWCRPVFKFPIFALAPTLPLFRLHQIIAYGGWLGEYYQYGLGPYLAGFGIYWATLTIYLLAYAAALRVPVELLAVGAAVLTPRHAVRVRRLSERAAALLYFGGVPAVGVLRFLP